MLKIRRVRGKKQFTRYDDKRKAVSLTTSGLQLAFMILTVLTSLQQVLCRVGNNLGTCIHKVFAYGRFKKPHSLVLHHIGARPYDFNSSPGSGSFNLALLRVCTVFA
jgi:hypothetical protein